MNRLRFRLLGFLVSLFNTPAPAPPHLAPTSPGAATWQSRPPSDWPKRVAIWPLLWPGTDTLRTRAARTPPVNVSGPQWERRPPARRVGHRAVPEAGAPEHSLRVDNRPFLRHSARMAKPALGRGLGALLGGNPVLTQPTPAPAAPVSQPVVLSPAPDLHERVQRVPLDRIRPCSLQPRKDFSAEALRELADSIREQGIVQPLIVRERGGHFELIAGERRWRAAQLLQLPEVPIIVRQADDRVVLELALIENLQRENLNAIEEAHGYEQLTGQFQLTQEEIAAKVGKSRAVVANALRLLKLPQVVQNFVREGRLSVGHAKVILGLSDEKKQKLAAERIIKQGLNVRQTEGLVAKLQARDLRKLGIKPETVAAPGTDPHVTNLEDRLREKFGTKVQLRYAKGKGVVEISFFSDEELERILQVLGITPD